MSNYLQPDCILTHADKEKAKLTANLHLAVYPAEYIETIRSKPS